MSDRLIEIEGLRYRYQGAEAEALAGVDLTLREGEFVGVVGPNGSGKSTLARLLGGLDRPAAARHATIAGHDLLTVAGRRAARRAVGVLFQNPDNQLVGATVEDDIAFGLENLALPAAEIRHRVDEILREFGLEELKRREPHLLSGGQKQRTALAGVLAVPRRVLVLDEPTSMLDPGGRRELLATVARQRAAGLSLVFVTQEMEEVLRCDRVVAVEAGMAIFGGTPRELFADAALLRRLSLGLPPAARLALSLADAGRRFERLPLERDELVAALGGEPG